MALKVCYVCSTASKDTFDAPNGPLCPRCREKLVACAQFGQTALTAGAPLVQTLDTVLAALDGKGRG